MTHFANDPDERDVLDFLKRNPDFLANHVDSLLETNAPNRPLGIGVADFQKHMINRLQGDIAEARNVTQYLIEHSRDNITGMQRIFQGVLGVLDCPTFESTVDYILDTMPQILNIDCIAIGIETDTTTILPTPTLALLESGTVAKLLPHNKIILQSHMTDAPPIIYRTISNSIQSHALCPLDLGKGTPPALVAFASHRAEGFHPDQATDLILFLTAIMGRVLGRWFTQPTLTIKD